MEEYGGARGWLEGVEMGRADGDARMLASVLRPLRLHHHPRHARARPRPALARLAWLQVRREDKDNARGEESDALQEEGGYGNGRNRPNTSGHWVAYQKHTPENLGA